VNFVEVDFRSQGGVPVKDATFGIDGIARHPLTSNALWDALEVNAASGGGVSETYDANIVGMSTSACPGANQIAKGVFEIRSKTGGGGNHGVMTRASADGNIYHDYFWDNNTLHLRYRNGPGAFFGVTTRTLTLDSATFNVGDEIMVYGASVGTTMTARIIRMSDGKYLDYNGGIPQWVIGETDYLTGAEVNVSGAGRAGIRFGYGTSSPDNIGLHAVEWNSEEISALAAGVIRAVGTPYTQISHTWCNLDATNAAGGVSGGIYTYQLLMRVSGVGGYVAVPGATSLKPHIDTLSPGTAYDIKMQYSDGVTTVESVPVTFTTMATAPKAVLAFVFNSWGVPHTLDFTQGMPYLIASANASDCVSFFYANGGQTWAQLDAQSSAPNSTSDYTTDIDALWTLPYISPIPRKVVLGFENLNSMVTLTPSQVMAATDTFFANRIAAGANFTVNFTVPDVPDSGLRTDANAATLSADILASASPTHYIVDLRQSVIFHNGTNTANHNATYWEQDAPPDGGLHIKAPAHEEWEYLTQPALDDILDTPVVITNPVSPRKGRVLGMFP
jgi:hypothetical protein